MIRDLSIDGFRRFQHFEMHDLGCVNLLVGTNNSGKTSALEAIQILTTGQPRTVWSALSRRGERLPNESEQGRTPEVDLCHLFHGHALRAGSQFRLNGSSDSTRGSLTATVLERFDGEGKQADLFEVGEAEYVGPYDLTLKGEGFATTDEAFPISRRGGLSYDALRKLDRPLEKEAPSTWFITTASMSPDRVVSLYEDIVLRPEEDLVVQALQTVEPTIERIATTRDGPRYNRGYSGERGGVVVKCRGTDERIPIGSLGDGTWRILGMALALVNAEHGVLLIDEIDTGLHFSVMSDMWKLVRETAARLDVQVFATTHSRDAVESLAAISRPDVGDGSDVTIQRLEPDKQRSVALTEQEIVVAAERGIEVR